MGGKADVIVICAYLIGFGLGFGAFWQGNAPACEAIAWEREQTQCFNALPIEAATAGFFWPLYLSARFGMWVFEGGD
jgi:hypothetical protein